MGIKTVTVTSQNLSAAGPCAQATQAQRIEGWAAPWAGVPCGAGRACHAGSGRHASQPGTAGSVAVVRVFALPPHSPADAGLFVGRRSATAAATLPACAGTQGASQALGKSRMYLSALISRGSYPRTDTLVQIAQACGYRVELVCDVERIELEAE